MHLLLLPSVRQSGALSLICMTGTTLSHLNARWEACLYFCSRSTYWKKVWPIKVYAAAVLAGHAGCDRRPIFSHPLVKRYLRGARRVRPVSLGSPHHVAVSRDPLDALSFKTALILALLSAKWAGELTALSDSLSSLLLNEDSSFALLPKNPRRRSCISHARCGRWLYT